MKWLVATLPSWLGIAALIVAAVGAALGLHWLLLKIARRAAARSRANLDDIVVQRMCAPLRWVLIGLALSGIRPALALGEPAVRVWNQLAGLVFPALLGWMAIAILSVVTDLVRARADISIADNLRARQRRTRADILHRIGIFLILLVSLCMMLMSIPSVRNVGVTLIASAGLAALAAGAAAQPALKNLVSGLQMAFTEPIRIDDVVIVEGEWGRIEEIRLTYVVVKLWDERRLIVPVSKFLEQSFQAWTRTTSQILGSVFWYLDPSTDVDALRAKLGELVRANKAWDGRFFNLQVTDTRPEAIEVRALMTAKDASAAFDLRCDIRESMLAFIRRQMPEAIVRYRGDLALPAGDTALT